MFDKMKLNHRFAIAIGAIVFGFVVYGALSFTALNRLKVNGPVYQGIVEGKDLVADILPPPEYIIESYLVALQIVAATDNAKQDTLIERLKALRNEFDTRHQFWAGVVLAPEVANLLLKQAHDPAVAFYQIAFNELIPARQKNDVKAVESALQRMTQAYEDHRSVIDRIVNLVTKSNEASEKRAADEIHTSVMMMLAILAGSLMIGITVAAIVVRGIKKQLGGEPAHTINVALGIARGDLTTEVVVRSGDSVSLLAGMKAMQKNLRDTVHNIKESTDSISTASKEIAAGNVDLSQRTEEQASSLEETASSMEELTSTVKQNAENAKQANQLAARASEIAVKGGVVVGQVVTTMNSINESSKKIADIISVIDGIAFQTNILALNAAVEAARAGEQGRGFAVVATEVRNLAQRSAAAAKEIKGLISDSVNKAEDGTRLVDEAGKTMSEIVSSVKRVTDIMAEISAASQEQSAGIEQVNQAVTQIDEVTQQNAALVEEAAAAAESMQEQAQNLTQAVSVFKLADAQQAACATPVTSQPKAEMRQLTPRATARPQALARVVEARGAERRAAGRAKNVARLPVTTGQTAAAKPAVAAGARSGSADEWREF